MKKQLLLLIITGLLTQACSDNSADINNAGNQSNTNKMSDALDYRVTTIKPTSISSVVQLHSDNSAKLDEEFELVVQQLEAELLKIDDAQIMQYYNLQGSGVALQVKSFELQGEPYTLNRTVQGLVSNVTSVSGATSIIGDPSGFGFTVDLSGDYLFEFDKDSLTRQAKASLESVLLLYKEHEGGKINVVGHTDSKGTQQYNQDLSQRRADSVKKWFTAAGVDQNLIKTQGLGETKPIAPNIKDGEDFPEGRAKNRRVEIRVKTNKKINHLPVVSDKTLLNR